MISGRSYTIHLFRDEDLAAMTYYYIKGSLYANVRHGRRIPASQKQELLRGWYGTTAPQMVQLMEQDHLPRSLRRDFALMTAEYLELAGGMTEIPSEVSSHLRMIRQGLSEYPASEDEIGEVQETIRREIQQEKDYRLWIRVLNQQAGGAAPLEDLQSGNAQLNTDNLMTLFRIFEMDRYAGSPSDSHFAVNSIGHYGNVVQDFQMEYINRRERGELTAPNEPIVYRAPGGEVRLYMQSRRGGGWSSVNPGAGWRLLDITNYGYTDNEGTQHRVVFAIQGRSLGSVKTLRENQGVHLPAQTGGMVIPLIMEFHKDVLEQTLDKERDFRTDFSRQFLIFLMPDKSLKRKYAKPATTIKIATITKTVIWPLFFITI